MSFLTMKFIIGTTFVGSSNGMTYTVISRTTDSETKESLITFKDKSGNLFKNIKEEELESKLNNGSIKDLKLLDIFNYRIGIEVNKSNQRAYLFENGKLVRELVPTFKYVKENLILENITYSQIDGIINFLMAKNTTHLWRSHTRSL